MRLVALISLAAIVATSSVVRAAPLSYTGGAYMQNFNGLPTSNGFLPPSAVIPGRGPHDIMGHAGMPTTDMEGWTISNPVELGSTGTNAVNTEYRAHMGELSGGNGRGVVSFGDDNSSERALGELPTSDQVSRFGVALTNNSGVTRSSLALNFTIEQWRRGDVTVPAALQNTLQYDYAITNNPAHNIDTAGIFTNIGTTSSPTTTGSLTALNGNLPTNQVPIAALINNLNWTPGSTLMLRWSAHQASGQDDGLGIDNLTLLTTAIPEPATAIGLFLAAMGGMFVRRRG